MNAALLSRKEVPSLETAGERRATATVRWTGTVVVGNCHRPRSAGRRRATMRLGARTSVTSVLAVLSLLWATCLGDFDHDLLDETVDLVKVSGGRRV